MKLVSFGNLGQEGGPEFSPTRSRGDRGRITWSRTGRTIKARCTTVRDVLPTISRRRSRTIRRRASLSAARCRRTCRCSPRRGNFRAAFPAFIFDFFLPYQELGVDYIVGVLKGYGQKPAGMTMAANMQYNEYFPGHAIGMPPPLTDGAVDIHRRRAADGRSVFQGRCRVPHVGGRAASLEPASGPVSSL